MTNEEILKEYGSEKWVVEETLYFLLQEYEEKKKEKPLNKVSFVKNFLKEESLTNVYFAEKSKMYNLEERENVEDIVIREITVEKEKID